MLIIPAYAKINLGLVVRGRRSDGFHEIDSVTVTVDWHDLVGVTLRAAAATTVQLRLTGATSGGVGRRGGRSAAGGDIPGGGDNLAVRAAHAVAALGAPAEVDLWLHKRLPSRAGLGGGSADAAAVLRGCAAALEGHVDRQTLFALAASLGSDVPVLLGVGAQRVRGRGEQLTSLAARPLHLAVAVVAASATAATYAATRDFDHDDSARVDRLVAALAEGRIPGDEVLGSGLEAPACRAHPDLDEGLTALRAAIPDVRWHLTGSGGAAFALAEDAGHAGELAGAAEALGVPARACRTVGCGGPAAPAAAGVSA